MAIGLAVPRVVLACGLVLARAVSAAAPLEPAAVSVPASPPPPSSAAANAPAVNDDPVVSGATPAARLAAQAALAQGNQRLKEGDAGGAIVHYRRAQAIYHAAAGKIEFNIAKAEQGRGDQPAAAAAFERFLAQAVGSSPEFREEATNELRVLAAALGALKFSQQRSGLVVAVDGHTEGNTPITGNVWVRPGRRLVTVKEGDHLALEQTVEVAAGATVELKIASRPIDSTPGAAAAAAPVSMRPRMALQLSPAAGGPGATTSSSAPALHLADTPAEHLRTPVWKTWWFWTAAGILVAGATATVIILANRCPSNATCMAAHY